VPDSPRTRGDVVIDIFPDGTETMTFRNTGGDLTIQPATEETPMSDCPCGKKADGGLCDECRDRW
jgi:hypothetical protein